MATHIDANASLISKRSTSSIASPARVKRLRDRDRRARGRCRRGRRRRRPRAHDRERLEAVRLRGRSATTSAAAPSLSPDELPAVIVKPSISGCSGLSAASFSIVVSRRGCSSTVETSRPSRASPRSGRSPPRSGPRRSPRPRAVRPQRPGVHLLAGDAAFSAVFQPTVIDMSIVGASGGSGWVGDIQATRLVGRRPLLNRGDVDAEFGAARDHDLVHAGADAGRGALHRGQARRAVPVEREPGHRRQPALDRGVAGDVAAAVEPLAEDDVVDRVPRRDRRRRR